ncbi:response regulator transcription factor [Pseudobdellovibrio sp. HCB154]|uniref:response regulator transcription factor n=1 Tax=Pseudobdellovibrio sp. HCB154 TaxID=3386277 RepID=UPI003916CD33
MNNHILIVEDDTRLANSLQKDFSDAGYTVFIADRVDAIPALNTFTHALVDLRLAAGDFGLDAIAKIQSSSPQPKIIVLSGYGSITTAVEAVKRGAMDYLTKPTSFAEIEKAFLGVRVNSTSDFKRRSLSEVEHEYIDFVLTKNDGNISQTAKDLGLHRQSLQRKLKKYI